MSDWKRTTKEVSFVSLSPDKVSAINKYIERYNLGSILSGALMCIQIYSEKIKKGLFENASAFIGLEENAAGRKFKETVISAAQNAK